MTMAPATEAVMGSLPRAKAGVGSAINDTTRQVGGALGVAIIGTIVSSVYAARVADLSGVFGLSTAETAQAESSLGGAQQVAGTLGDSAPSFVDAVNNGFVDALSIGLRMSAVAVVIAAVVAWKFLPSRAHDPFGEFVEPAEQPVSMTSAGQPIPAPAPTPGS
jgi:hypothetical protein